MCIPAMPTTRNRLNGSVAAKKDLMALPADVRRLFGFALSLAQVGDKHDSAKKLPKRMQRSCGNENPNC
jgi:phage-related protein